MLFIPSISDNSSYSIERKKIKSSISSSGNANNNNVGMMMMNSSNSGGLTENIVCIRSTLVIAGYAACIITAAFAIAVVFIPPGPESDTGLLRYISEGIHQYCGWSIVIMGTTSMILLVCHLVAASHMASSSLAFYCALGEAFGWNVILGVVDTGWVIHYIGLLLFLVGSIGYHWIACRDDAYGGFRYQQTNLLAISLTIIFSLVSSASLIVGDGDRRLRACAVSLEFSMLGAFTLQNLVLLYSLDQFKNIHLVFHRASNNNNNNGGNNL